MTAPDPKRILESRLLQALEGEAFLGDGRSVQSLSEWMVFCGDIPDSTILCDLPVLLGRLARDDRRTGKLQALGLLPETGSLPLFHQALAARVSSHARALADAARDRGEPAPVALPARVMREAKEAREVRQQMDVLADAALAVEAERERLESEYKTLADTLANLEAEVAKGIRTFAESRSTSPRALAELAESMGLEEEARLLRALPRLPFAPPVPHRATPRLGEDRGLRVTMAPVTEREPHQEPLRH